MTEISIRTEERPLVPVKASSYVSLTLLAREALEEAEGRVDDAVEHLLDRLLDDREMLRAILIPVVRNAVQYLTGAMMRSDRAAIIANSLREPEATEKPAKHKHVLSPAAAVQNGRSHVAALAVGHQIKGLLDMPILNGRMKLKDATKTDLMKQYEENARLARGMVRNANFYAAWAAKLDGRQKVADVFKEDGLVAIMKAVSDNRLSA